MKSKRKRKRRLVKLLPRARSLQRGHLELLRKSEARVLKISSLLT